MANAKLERKLKLKSDLGVDKDGSDPDVVALVNSMHQESDRGCILVATAYIETLLDQLLARSFVDNASLRENLLGPRSALGNLAARIDLIYALGLLSTESWLSLHKVREIRNEVAHDLDVEVFGRAMGDKLRDLPGAALLKAVKKVHPRVLFNVVTMHLVSQLSVARESCKHAKPPLDVDDWEKEHAEFMETLKGPE